MAKAIFLAWTNPLSPEEEARFNSWYEGTHIEDIRQAVQGITAVNRYRRSEVVNDPESALPKHSYLAVYELDSDDLEAALAQLKEGTTSGRIGFDASLDREHLAPLIGWYSHV